ncbi:MAG: DUF1670 domain-containing protein [Actinomycetota bacterium]|nr:DUF1670 domain-containing protein [Actinomycetota bacterium]
MAGTERLAAKDTEWAIVTRIAEDFQLPPCIAKDCYDRLAGYFAEYGQGPVGPGEFCFLAVAADEPAGKPLVACRKVQVQLELTAPEDLAALQEQGLWAMRQCRLVRLARQAQEQGGLLTLEDLAYLTCSSLATVKRDLSEFRKRGEVVPTRGQSRQVAGDVSSRAEVVRLYLWGRTTDEITDLVGSGEEAVRRDLVDFSRVAALHAEGLSTQEIGAATGLPSRLVSEYLGISERARKESPAAPRLNELLEAV